ncbi:uncharacterized protein [Diadema setosum]|uniref:uncharacterized protein n=1 Tax=Diadema setosum TaxID=31175 RepID=UPI003B3B8CC8
MELQHGIEECADKSQSHRSSCTHQPPSNTTFLILTCVLSGFKPDVSMIWTDDSGKRLKTVASRQTTLSDDTYERLEKINVSAKHGTERTLVCIATGDSVNGTSTKEITLLSTSGSCLYKISGKHINVGLIIGLSIGVPVAVLILFLLLRKLQQKVSEELTSTEQTTLNSEDESRKWYSIKWADFKLCCRRLRDVSSQHPRIPFWFYVFYRTTLAAYFFVFFITYVVLGVKALGAKFFIYLPVWAYTASVCYVCLAFFNVAMDFVKTRKNAAFEDKVRYQIQWCLFNITAASCSIVTSGFWIDLYYNISAKIPILVYVCVDLLPTVACLAEIFLTLIVVRFVHVVYPGIFMTVYLLFTVIYWAVGGTDPFGNSYISPFLDYGNYPGIAAATAVGTAFASVAGSAVFKGLHALRVRCMDSKREEAIPATEEPSPVELEALTT